MGQPAVDVVNAEKEMRKCLDEVAHYGPKLVNQPMKMIKDIARRWEERLAGKVGVEMEEKKE